MSFCASLVAQMLKHLTAMGETWVLSLGREDSLEEMATHSSTLAWNIPRTEEPGRLQPMGLQRVRHDWATSRSLSTVSPKSRADAVLQDGGSSPCCWTIIRVKRRCEDWIGLHETHRCNLNRRELNAKEMDPNWDGVKWQKGDERMEVRLQTTDYRQQTQDFWCE